MPPSLVLNHRGRFATSHPVGFNGQLNHPQGAGRIACHARGRSVMASQSAGQSDQNTTGVPQRVAVVRGPANLGRIGRATDTGDQVPPGANADNASAALGRMPAKHATLLPLCLPGTTGQVGKLAPEPNTRLMHSLRDSPPPSSPSPSNPWRRSFPNATAPCRWRARSRAHEFLSRDMQHLLLERLPSELRRTKQCAATGPLAHSLLTPQLPATTPLAMAARPSHQVPTHL